jgi:calcineurin-like phosphoesterase family protein
LATYFWSDTHFGHRGIIGYCGRQYQDVEEMNAALISRWNAAVKKETDTVWFLGDFGFHSSTHLLEIFYKLRGKKCLVPGNHDDRNKSILKFPWERVERLHTYKEDSLRAELCHYPLMTWKMQAHGALMLHGHSHGTLPKTHPRRIDVGCDVFQWPLTLNDLFQVSLQREAESVKVSNSAALKIEEDAPRED